MTDGSDASISPRSRWRRPAATALAATVGAACLFAIWQGFSRGMASFLISRAVAAISSGRVESGLAHLDRARGWDPGNPQGQRLRALALEAEDRPAAAITTLEELRLSGRAPVDAIDQLARLLEESGEIARARALYRELATRAPQSIVGPLGLARTGGPPVDGARRAQSSRAGTPAALRGVCSFHLDDELGRRGYGTAAAAESLARAVEVGANAVSLRVPARQGSVGDPILRTDAEPPGGESRRALVRAIRDAHTLGLRVLLKPHVMLDEITKSQWRGTMRFDDAEDHETWWRGYREFVLSLADLAEVEGVEILCVGVELRGLVAQSPDRWESLIGEVRERYSGTLTYAANWYHEYAEVPFWHLLDLVGIQFFPPLADRAETDLATVEATLAEQLENLGELAFALGKPVLLTEVGYRSTPDALVEPWRWPEAGAETDPKVQALAYRAVLEGVGRGDWCAGLFWWNWLTVPDPGGKFRHDFTPQGKPAEELLRSHWSPRGQ